MLDFIVPVFLVYGLAFYTMGFALALQSGYPLGNRAVERGVVALAAFALMHGLHEWVEMFLLIVTRVYGYTAPLAVGIGRVAVLVASFTLLSVAGCCLLCRREGGRARSIMVTVLLVIFLAGLAVIFYRHGPGWPGVLGAADAWARYSLGVTGAVLAGAGLIRRGQAYREASRSIVRGFVVAGGALIAYGVIGQTAPAPSALFPSTVYNSQVFAEVVGFPVQLVRALAAVTATAGLIVALRGVEAERRRALQAALDAKLAAQALAEQEMARREVLQKELLRRTVTAQEDERARIARELHDQTGQTLTALAYRVAALDTGRALTPEAIGSLKELTNQALADLRGLVTDLRPPQLDDLGLVAALHWLADQMRVRLDFDVVVKVEGQRQRLSPAVETSLFRIAQEALTNAARHAGAGSAMVRLVFARGRVTVEIVDEGVGFDVAAVQPETHAAGHEAWGIFGMAERAELVGGRLELHSERGVGTTVRVNVPVFGETTHEPERADQITAGR